MAGTFGSGCQRDKDLTRWIVREKVAGLSRPAIARKVGVCVDTVKKHLKSEFGQQYWEQLKRELHASAVDPTKEIGECGRLAMKELLETLNGKQAPDPKKMAFIRLGLELGGYLRGGAKQKMSAGTGKLTDDAVAKLLERAPADAETENASDVEQASSVPAEAGSEDAKDHETDSVAQPEAVVEPAVVSEQPVTTEALMRSLQARWEQPVVKEHA
jgi:hypothetical protein